MIELLCCVINGGLACPKMLRRVHACILIPHGGLEVGLHPLAARVMKGLSISTPHNLGIRQLGM